MKAHIKNNRLHSLVRLVDDDTAEVQAEINKELTGYGMSLEQDLLEFADILSPKQIKLLKPFLENNRREWLKKSWQKLSMIHDDFEKIELGMYYISKFQYGLTLPTNLTLLLNEFANDFNNFYPYGNEIDLAVFLFQQKGLSGAKKDYYNPFNSNMIYGIQHKKGIPITLTMIYVLVGQRLGFDIDGCNFPGHYLAKFYMDSELILVDCFNYGRLIYENEIHSLSDTSYDSIMSIIEQRFSGSQTLKRVLTNLTTAYKKNGDEITSQFFLDLAKMNV